MRILRATAAGLVAALSLAAGAAASSGPPSESAIEVQLVCPTCHETLDESNAPVAREMKDLIRLRIAQGRSEKQILDEMVAQFGPGVLSTPATHGFDLIAWVLPIGGIGAGALGLGGGALYWARRREGDGSTPVEGVVDPELDRRIDEELAHFDD